MALYNFEPDQAYIFRCQDSSGNTVNGSLSPDPTLPALLADLNLTVDREYDTHSNYVLVDTPDCQRDQHYLASIRNSAFGWHINWYQHIEGETEGTRVTGWSWTDDGTILANVDQRYIYEWDLAGTLLHTVDFSDSCSGASGDVGPCPHHGSYRVPGSDNYYVLTGKADITTYNPASDAALYAACTAQDGFVDDGFQVYSSSFVLDDEYYYMDTMGADPALDAGPNGAVCASGYWGGPFADDVIDWTHFNSVFATEIGGVTRVTLSSRLWDMILRYLPGTNTVDWILGGQGAPYTDFTLVNGAGVTGREDFGGQHNVSEVAGGDLLFFDNRTHIESGPVRAVQIDLDTTTSTATILRNWVMRRSGTSHTTFEFSDCNGLGSANLVPGTSGEHVLVNCGPARVIQELDEYNGSTTLDPILHIELPSGDYCATSAETSPGEQFYWYRAWPLVEFGEF